MKAKMGRPTNNPRNKILEIILNEEEDKKLKECSEKLSLTKTDVLMKGLDEVYKQIKK